MGRFKEIVLIKGVFSLFDIRYHSNLGLWYSRIGDMLSWSPERILDWQTKQMKNLLADAYVYSPYYHQLFDSLSLKPSDFHSIADLELIPPLTKEIVRDRFDDILLKGKKQIHYRYSSTGGSTGNPTKYVKDNNSWGFDNAFTIHMWKQTGYHYGDKFLALGSSSLFPTSKKSVVHSLYYGLKGKIPFNAMNMSSERIGECVDVIRRERIHYIYGYASSIFLLAQYIEENHLENEVDIRACFPTSEILTDVYRSTMERVFECPVSDMYGAHDGGIVAHKITTGYKVGYNCIVQTEGKESFGPVLLTDVTSNSFPFIRYQLGDVVEIGRGYNAFYNGQVLNRVIGRTGDVITLENNRVLTGPGFTVLFSKLPVIGYRIYKSGPLQLTVEVVRGQGYSEDDENLIINTMHKHCGDDCEVILKYAEHVQTRENGKNLYFLNDGHQA